MVLTKKWLFFSLFSFIFSKEILTRTSFVNFTSKASSSERHLFKAISIITTFTDSEKTQKKEKCNVKTDWPFSGGGGTCDVHVDWRIQRETRIPLAVFHRCSGKVQKSQLENGDELDRIGGGWGGSGAGVPGSALGVLTGV